MHVFDTERHKGEFFKVLGATERSQIATMTIKPGSDSGQGDPHPGDQVVYVIEGVAEVEVGGEVQEVGPGTCVIIPHGADHRIFNRSSEDVFFVNVYTPPAY